MSYAAHSFDSFEEFTPRAVKKAPVGTDPLHLTSSERKTIDAITLQFVGNKDSMLAKIAKTDEAEAKKLQRNIVAGMLNVPSSSIIHQVRSTYAAIVGIEAAEANNMNAVVQAALMGLRELAEVQGVAPFIFQKSDGASRNLVPDERVALKDLALRLGAAARTKTEADADRARCLRAMVCAAIAAERGLIHIAAENFGAVIATCHSPFCEFRSKIDWTEELHGYAARWSRATVKMP